MLHSVETTQIMDPTNELGCKCCPLAYTCRFYHTICDLQRNSVPFGARLLCTLLKVEDVYAGICAGSVLSPHLFPSTTAYSILELFLPAINNNLKAFYKYDFETCPEWAKVTVMTTLSNTLKKWECLQDFDFMFSQDVEETAKRLLREKNHNASRIQKNA